MSLLTASFIENVHHLQEFVVWGRVFVYQSLAPADCSPLMPLDITARTCKFLGIIMPQTMI